jgi:hypothetical protein
MAGNGMVVAKGLRLEKKPLTAPNLEGGGRRDRDNRLEDGHVQEGVDYWKRPPSGNANIRRDKTAAWDSPQQSRSPTPQLSLSDGGSGQSNRIRGQLNREFMTQNSKIPLKAYAPSPRSPTSKSLSGMRCLPPSVLASIRVWLMFSFFVVTLFLASQFIHFLFITRSRCIEKGVFVIIQPIAEQQGAACAEESNLSTES